MALDKDPAMLVQKGGGENTSCWNKGGLRRKQEHDFIKTQINMPSEAQIYIYIQKFSGKMTLLCLFSCIKDQCSITSKDRAMGLWEREADTRGSRVAGQMAFKSHVQTLITVRCIINSYNLPHGPAKPTYPLQTVYYQLSSLSPSVDPNGQSP